LYDALRTDLLILSWDVYHSKYLLSNESYRYIDRGTLLLSYSFCVGFLEHSQVSIRNLKLGNNPGCEHARDRGRDIGSYYTPNWGIITI